MDNKSAYAEKLRARLDQWRAKIDSLKAQAKEASADAQIRCQKEVDELRARQKEAEKKLHALDEAQGQAWKDLTTGIETAWDDIGDEVRNAAGRFS